MIPRQIDAPDSACAFHSHGCTRLMSGHGGFDEHHEHPLSLGSVESGPKLVLCPNHHRRQHSLIRYLVETLEANDVPDGAVTRHFSAPERQAAQIAVAGWVQAGKPEIANWPCPAARVVI